MKPKRIVAAILAAGLLSLSVVPNGFAQPASSMAAETGQNTSRTYENGTEMESFRVVDSHYKASTSTESITMEHIKTGAKLVWFKNKDTDRGFSIAFHSPATNSKGINHILEHSLIGSSKKYPDVNLFFSAINNTYNSFINAMTYQNMTIYPVSSLSEKQLLKLTDIYMDCVFNPTVLTDERYFQREAWRYELSSAKDDIIVNGTVYNEMRGNMGNINTAALYNSQKTIFNSNQGYNAGGEPKEVLALNYKEFVNTYKKYYHPSNSLITLYGDIQIKDFLSLLDQEYLSKYEKKAFKHERNITKGTKEPIIADFDFPAAKNAETKNKAIIDYVFAGDDIQKMGIDSFATLAIVSTVLNSDTMPFKQALNQSGIAGSYSISIDQSAYQPTVHIMAVDADPAKKMDFYNLVNKEFEKIVQDGFNQGYLKSLISSLRFNNALGREGQSGLMTMINAQLMNNIAGDPNIDLLEYYSKKEKEIGTGSLEREVKEFFVDNKRRALVTTTPKAGLLEEENAALAKQLRDKKAAMSEKEINAMVKQSKDFNAWNSQASSPELIDSLKAISVSELPVELPNYSITDTKKDNARILTAKADIADVNRTTVLFDESHLTMEELLYLNFYLQMLTYRMPTESHSEQALNNELMSKTSSSMSFEMFPLSENGDSNQAHPTALVTFYAMNDEYPSTIALSKELLLHADLTNGAPYINRTLNYQKAYFTSAFADPLNFSMVRAAAYTNLSSRYSDYFTGLSYYEFLKKIEKQAASDPQVILDRLEQVRNKAFNQKDMILLFAGDETSIEAFEASLDDYIKGFPDQSYPDASYTLPVPARREALTTNTTVQYIGYNADLSAAGLPYEGGLLTMATLLDDALLIPEIRYKGGAYGAGASFPNTSSLQLYSYRDNNFVHSLAIMGGTDEFLKALTDNGLKDSDLESYIMAAFGKYNTHNGPLTGAYSALGNYLTGFTRDKHIKLLNEIKASKASDYKDYASKLEKLNETANYVVIASPEMIAENKDLFDRVIPLQ